MCNEFILALIKRLEGTHNSRSLLDIVWYYQEKERRKNDLNKSY